MKKKFLNYYRIKILWLTARSFPPKEKWKSLDRKMEKRKEQKEGGGRGVRNYRCVILSMKCWGREPPGTNLYQRDQDPLAFYTLYWIKLTLFCLAEFDIAKLPKIIYRQHKINFIWNTIEKTPKLGYPIQYKLRFFKSTLDANTTVFFKWKKCLQIIIS